MNSKFITISIFVITGAVVGLYPFYHHAANAKPPLPQHVQQDRVEKPRIQLAILLDTSGSMSGLIDQTRNQLWQVVNEFSESKKNGITPTLEVAVFEYGNSGLSSESGYIRQVTGLTRELDQVSEALFSLTTNGGDEYCGYVINTAVTNLEWSRSDNDIKAIFIAGNEPFTQGPVPFKQAIASAKGRGITVNTIHAGTYDQGASSGWREGAILAGGDYMSIDHNHRVAHVVAPQDKKIAELNAQLNETYIPFGKDGDKKAQRQAMQDEKSNGISLGLLAKRVKSKVSSMYNNANWDLVDAIDAGSVDLQELDEELLPNEMRAMSDDDRKKYVANKALEREQIKAEIMAQSKEREDYVAEEQRNVASPAVSTIDAALSTAIRKQGAKKDYDFAAQ